MSDSDNDKASSTLRNGSLNRNEKCPVDHENGIPTSLWRLFGKHDQANTDDGPRPQTTISAGVGATGATNTADRRPASLEEAAKHVQTPHPHQRLPLSTYRLYSSIPRGTPIDGDGNVPHHQIVVDSKHTVGTAGSSLSGNTTSTESKTTWVYPSEQQVFNAMKRKGWDAIEEESIPSFLQVHNSVNERSWRMLCEWERKFGGLTASGTDDIKLVRFEGRPTDMTPKALLLSTLGLKPKPFDRHDWYIDNGTDHEKRYVLDFYMSGYEDGGSDIPRVDIDVRPALDTPHAVVQRGQRIFQELFPGISKELGLLYSKTNSGRGD